MSKFTKGEWTIGMSSMVSYECGHEFIYPESLQVRQNDEDVHIALVNHAYPEWQHNAKLIASAPEMYSLIADALRMCKGREVYASLYMRAVKLLKYIDGEEIKHE